MNDAEIRQKLARLKNWLPDNEPCDAETAQKRDAAETRAKLEIVIEILDLLIGQETS
jgi:hypothetical protein